MDYILATEEFERMKKELKKFNRSYHQFVVSDKRKFAKNDSIIDTSDHAHL